MRLDRVAPEPSLSETLRRVMLQIALRQEGPDREAMLAIMRKDGWL